jgi:DNA-binding response OmpR family regulator
MKILLIEDEEALRQSIAQSLEKEKYLVEIASDFHEAAEKLAIYAYDCILLDIGLPGGSGLTLLNQLKADEKKTNVIIISAKDSLDDKIKGLDLGADDYLSKPFHNSELNARIKAVLRRKDLSGKNILEWGNVSCNLDDRHLKINNVDVESNRKEFDILCFFLMNKNRLITKYAIAEHVWGDNMDQVDNFDFIYYQIKNIRKKLLQHKATIEIEAVYGMGYKLLLP